MAGHQGLGLAFSYLGMLTAYDVKVSEHTRHQETRLWLRSIYDTLSLLFQVKRVDLKVRYEIYQPEIPH